MGIAENPTGPMLDSSSGIPSSCLAGPSIPGHDPKAALHSPKSLHNSCAYCKESWKVQFDDSLAQKLCFLAGNVCVNLPTRTASK